MDNFPSKQEIFDALAYVPAEIEVMYNDMNELAKKHIEDFKTVGFTDKYYDELAALAEKHGVKYTNPKFVGGLRTVETRPTVH
jgi:hypothetical protein